MSIESKIASLKEEVIQLKQEIKQNRDVTFDKKCRFIIILKNFIEILFEMILLIGILNILNFYEFSICLLD